MEEKIIKILELVQMKEEGIVEFTAESKALIMKLLKNVGSFLCTRTTKTRRKRTKKG